jgi:hypothetical protein
MSATKLPPALTGTAKKYASGGRKDKHLIRNLQMLNKLKQNTHTHSQRIQ